MLKIGLIGVGKRGSCLASLLKNSERAQIVYGVDADPDSARHFMKEHDLRFDVRNSVLEMAQDPQIDGIIVATPDHFHAEHASLAMRGGKAVFCEKPMAINIPDCDQMLRVRNETKAALTIGFNLRHQIMYKTMKEISLSGELGEITSVWVRHFVGKGGNFYFQDWHSLRSKSNSLLLQKATHDIDLIHYISGQYTRRLTALGKRSYYGGDHPNDLSCPTCEKRSECPDATDFPVRNQCAFRSEIDVEDNEMVMMELEKGAIANYSQCHFTPDYHRSFTFIGTKGRMESFEPMYGRTGLEKNHWEKEHRLEVLFRNSKPSKTYHFASLSGDNHGGADPVMMNDWLSSIQKKDQNLESAIAGRQSVAVGCLAAESLRGNNEWKTLPAL
ncbi:MAG: Gfo/Idh/MocA family oxidoreductase [Verrucomicrobiota bacterium]